MITFSKPDITHLEQLLGVKKSHNEENKLLLEHAEYFARYFRFVPGIVLLGVGNSVAMNAGTQRSDIDLFIVSKKGSLWFVRIFMTIMVQAFGLRKTGKNHSGKFCLSFFCDESALDFSKFAIDRDIYLFYRMLTMKPLIVRGDTYERFWSLNDSWTNLGDYPEYREKALDSLIYRGKSPKTVLVFVRLLNWICKKLFLARTMSSYEKLGRPYGVIINEKMLKFHDNDQRKVLRDAIYNEATGKKKKDA